MNKSFIIEKAKNVKKVGDLNSLIMDLHAGLTAGEYLKEYVLTNSIIYKPKIEDGWETNNYFARENAVDYFETISKSRLRKNSANNFKDINRENKCKFKLVEASVDTTDLILNGTEILVKTIGTDDLVVYTLLKPHIVVEESISKVLLGINQIKDNSDIIINEDAFDDCRIFTEAIESYIFSKKHGFRIFRNTLLTSSQKNKSNNLLDLDTNISLAIDDEDYVFLEDVATHTLSLLSKQKKEYVDGFKNKERPNNLRYFFYNIDDKVDFSKPLNQNSELSSSTALSFDDTPYFKNALKDSSVISTLMSDIKREGHTPKKKAIGLRYHCGKCGETTDHFFEDKIDEDNLDELYSYNKEVILDNISKIGCTNCNTNAAFNLNDIDNLSHLNYFTNLFLLLGPSGDLLFNHFFYKKNTILLYRYSDRFENSVSMNFSTLEITFNTVDNKVYIEYEVQPKSLSSIDFSSKKPKMEYYINESDVIKRYTPSSLSNSISYGGYYSNAKSYPMDKKELIKDFEENGFNNYGVYDIYVEQNDLNENKYYQNMILWEGTFPTLIKLMPVVDAMLKIDKYKNIGLDLINDNIPSNEINSIFDVKETNPKKVLKLNNFKINIYNEFLNQNAITGYNYNMIKTMEFLSSYTEDFNYDVYNFFYKAFNGQSYINSLEDINGNISTFKTLINRILKLDLRFEIDMGKFFRNIVKIMREEYFMNLREFKHVMQMYIDYIDLLVDYKTADLIEESDILLEDLEREHDRLALMSATTFENSNTDYKQMFNETMEEIKKLLSVNIDNQDYVVVIPENYQDMIKEGNKLNHCVGSYITAIAQKRKVVVFVRSKNDVNTPLYTLELSGVYKDFQVIESKQFRGKFNTVPSPKAKIFAMKYIEQLNRNKTKRLLAN